MTEKKENRRKIENFERFRVVIEETKGRLMIKVFDPVTKREIFSKMILG